MLNGILVALWIHVLWFRKTYAHKGNPDRTVRVKAVCQVISLILTIMILMNLSEVLSLAQQAINVPPRDAATACNAQVEARELEQLVSVFQGPENYLRYLELKNGR